MGSYKLEVDAAKHLLHLNPHDCRTKYMNYDLSLALDQHTEQPGSNAEIVGRFRAWGVWKCRIPEESRMRFMRLDLGPEWNPPSKVLGRY